MKYIKEFKLNEELIDWQTQLYYIKDYVKLSASGFKDKLPRYGKITSIELPQHNSIIFYSIILSDNTTIVASNDRIERTLDKSEIEKYELDIAANKFNI